MHRLMGTRIFVRGVLLSIVLLCLFLMHTVYVHAQSIPGVSTGVHLIPSPKFPGPNESVEISLDDYSVDTVGATLSWYVNTVEQTAYKNERTLKLETGPLGKKMTVRVVLSRSNAPALSSSITIIPTVVDIILEAETYVPNFYKGRALPSKDSAVRAIAVVHDTTETPDTSYVYKWSQNGTVLLGGQVTGKNVLPFTVPHFGNTLLTVDVFKVSGEAVGSRSVAIVPAEPELHFYEYSSLRGLSQKEVTSPYALISEETTLYGEPYFMNAKMRERDATFTWKINGESALHETGTPNAITLQRVGGGGSADVDVTIVTKTQMPQYVKKALQLFFE